jgi:hypothetical protein
VEAQAEEILGDLLNKEIYDIRGKQASIGRLLPFYKEAFIHMLFYRILIIVSIFAGVVFLLSYFSGLFTQLFKPLFLIVWILFTPQVFETAKGTSVIATKGFVHGDLNKSYLTAAIKYEKHPKSTFYKFMPYAALAIWIVGFLSISAMWYL